MSSHWGYKYNEKSKTWQIYLLETVKKKKTSLTATNRWPVRTSFKYEVSNRESTKLRSMLPFQERMSEMSHKQHNLILTSLEIPWK